MSSDRRFAEQVATMNIMLRVTNVCSECFSDFHEGSSIFYDNLECRYICSMCHCKMVSSDENHCEESIGDSGLLF